MSKIVHYKFLYWEDEKAVFRKATMKERFLHWIHWKVFGKPDKNNMLLSCPEEMWNKQK